MYDILYFVFYIPHKNFEKCVFYTCFLYEIKDLNYKMLQLLHMKFTDLNNCLKLTHYI